MHIEPQEESFIALNQHEREALRFILEEFLLYQSYRNLPTRQCMRQRTIWINRKNFLENNAKMKGVRGLYRKKAIKPHAILGYTISIKEEYLSQIYNLLDNGDWDLVLQLAGIWLDTN